MIDLNEKPLCTIPRVMCWAVDNLELLKSQKNESPTSKIGLKSKDENVPNNILGNENNDDIKEQDKTGENEPVQPGETPKESI